MDIISIEMEQTGSVIVFSKIRSLSHSVSRGWHTAFQEMLPKV
jgi:hypothetical protein